MLQSVRSQRAGHDWVTEQPQQKWIQEMVTMVWKEEGDRHPRTALHLEIPGLLFRKRTERGTQDGESFGPSPDPHSAQRPLGGSPTLSLG